MVDTAHDYQTEGLRQSQNKSHMRSSSARDDKIHMNIERNRALHNEKLNKSNANFKNTRVTSCSGVLMKNGKAVAMCFN